MKPVDLILLGVLLVIAALAVYAIYRYKKKGKKCIGCPDSGNCSQCAGNCTYQNNK